MKSLAYATVITAALLSVASCNSPSSSTANSAVSAAAETAALSPDEQMIKSAESAAPAAIATGAGVVAVGADGKMRELRKSTNGFTCMPDSPETPGPDPMCGDANAMEWGMAWMMHKAPPKGKVGFMYMLAGGTDASNTDPFAKAAASDNHWIKTGPHVMVVGAKGMMEGYPRTADPDTSKPYVMWPDTEYEHLMLPVQ
jgi:hypothetical protein